MSSAKSGTGAGKQPEIMVIILIGVAGSGKTTVGKLLSEKLGWRFFDADDFHPKANIDKMSRGIALTDEDRWPWLKSIRDFIDDTDDKMVFACSALKKSYRDFLRLSTKRLEFIYLKGSKEVILERLEERKGHFAGADLLQSQFEDLEEPQNVPVEDITQNPDSIAADIIKLLKI